MSAPRTMLPEELESVRASVWHAKQIPVDSRDTVEHDLIALDAELDAERAAYATLERDLAAAQAEVVEGKRNLRMMCDADVAGDSDAERSVARLMKCADYLTRSPGSLSALEAWLTKAWVAGFHYAGPQGDACSATRAEDISRILGKEAAR